MVSKAVKEFLIRDLRPEDVPEVLAIEKASFTTPWSEILFMNEIFKPGSLPKAALLGEKIVGYICANYLLDEGHILNVTAHPDHRRQGIASQLVQHMTDLLGKEGCLIIFLEVRLSNEAALRMYEKAGFRILSARKAYYTHPVEDAVIMSLHLPKCRQ
ncbi:MAG: ribosomal protein S18-alanine N-acetyltransferase [Nitrospirae bacterium]|nr:ribosomal protein S18-alanine N-acetyltransferase [Nitrospirota bacterium]